MNLRERVVKREPQYRGSIINVERQIVKIPDGETATRDVVYHAKGAGALVITADHQMLLEKQWRAPVAKPTWEIPAGKVDFRDHGSSRHAMLRELNEEVRLSPGILKHLTGFYSSPGFTNEYLDLYLAKDVKPVQKRLPRDQGEYLIIKRSSLSKALAMIKDGQIKDAKTIMAIWAWRMMTNRETN